MTTTPETSPIDIAALFARPGGSEPDLDRRIARALREEGAFTATGGPTSADLERRARRLLSFFALPKDVKAPLAIRRCGADSANLYRGFTPLPEAPQWSYNEIFDIGPEPPLSAPDLPGTAAFREANVWPVAEALPGWREDMLAFSTACRGMAMAVVAAALRGLGLDTAEALAVCAGRNCTLRLLHCAPIPADFQISGEDGKSIPPEPDGRRVITRRHVDTGLLSVLWQDGRGGLQVQGRDEVWREVPPRSDAFSVHCGDLLAGLSAGALRATPHRVLGLGEERHAIGFFLEPDFTREVLPPDSDRPKAYAAHLIDEFPARFAAS